MIRYAIGLVALLTVFSSCKTDFSLTGDYEEKPLIYGLLDPNESVQLFRIQKAFLGEESAFIMAQSPDSSYFKYEDLFVELVEYNGANETNRWVLDTVRRSLCSLPTITPWPESSIRPGLIFYLWGILLRM